MDSETIQKRLEDYDRTPRAEGYLQGIRDAADLVAGFPTMRLVYDPSRGITEESLKDLIESAGVAIPVEDMPDSVRYVPLLADEIKTLIFRTLKTAIEPRKES